MLGSETFSQLLETTIQACLDCANACKACSIGNCKPEFSDTMDGCTRLCRDCADVSALCARLLARDSAVCFDICQTCATLCDLCAQHLDGYQIDHCCQCAVAARRCAEACREVVSQHFLMTA